MQVKSAENVENVEEGVNHPVESAQTIGEETHSIQLEGDIFCRVCL